MLELIPKSRGRTFLSGKVIFNVGQSAIDPSIAWFGGSRMTERHGDQVDTIISDNAPARRRGRTHPT
jgi:hypothetical protein